MPAGGVLTFLPLLACPRAAGGFFLPAVCLRISFLQTEMCPLVISRPKRFLTNSWIFVGVPSFPSWSIARRTASILLIPWADGGLFSFGPLLLSAMPTSWCVFGDGASLLQLPHFA